MLRDTAAGRPGRITSCQSLFKLCPNPVTVFYSPNIAINKSMSHIVKSVIWHEQQGSTGGSTGCSNCSASEMTYIVSSGALNSTHSLTAALTADTKA